MRSLCLLSMLFMLLAGCSGGVDSPVSPIDKHTDTMDNVPIIGVSSYGENFTAIGLMGAYELIINPDEMTADLITKRSSAIGEGYIVSGMSFFTMWPCSNCLKITGIALDANENAVLSFDVTHPFPPGNMNEPPTAMNRLDLDIFDVALVIVPQDGTTEAYPLTGVDTYPDICVDADGYTRELQNVVGNNAALPYFLVIDDSEAGTSTWNKLEMGESADFDIKFAPTDHLSFDMYLTFGYGFSAVRAQRLTPKYYNPEFNRKAPWKVEVIPPGPAEMDSTWDDGDDTTEYEVEVHVYNWQQGATIYGDPTDFDNAPEDNIYAASDVASVSVEIPGMTSALSTETDAVSGTGMPDDPLVYSIPIANENLLPEGQYHGIVKVSDQRSPGIIGDRDFLIDTPDGVMLNNYEMIEYATYQIFVADVVLGNTPPEIISGVDGNDQPFIMATDERYEVQADDPDGDPLFYSWKVTDVTDPGNPIVLLENDPGNADGTIDLDIASLFPSIDDVWDIDCDVTDEKSPPVPATTLQVTISNILFFDDMEDGEGEWLPEHFGPADGWGIIPGGNDGHWWHSNSGNNQTSGWQNNCCNMRLWTPELTIPAGVSEVHLEFYQQVIGWWSSNTIWAGTAFAVTTNDGATIEKGLFPLISTPQYSNWNYPYTSTYHWAMRQGGGPQFSSTWGVPAWAENFTPLTTVVDLSDPAYTDLRGRTVRIGFIYGSGYAGSFSWRIDDVKITVTP